MRIRLRLEESVHRLFNWAAVAMRLSVVQALSSDERIAHQLGVHRNTLTRKLAELGLKPSRTGRKR